MLDTYSARRTLSLLAGLAALFILARFLDLGSAPFINDEPQLQLMLDRHFAEHTFPRHGLAGTRGVLYGPTALWLYAPLRLLTDDVAWIAAYHVLLHCVGLVLVFFAIWTSVGLETALWTLLLMASSPYLFFYARLCWDNTFLIPLTALTLFCIARLERDATRLGAWFGLGLAAALVFNLHLMALPVIAAAALVALPIAWRNRRALRTLIGLLVATATFALTVAPYLKVVWSSLRQQSQAGFTREALSHALPDTLLGTGTYLSAAGMDYFMTDAMSSIMGRLGLLASGPYLAWIVRIVAWAWLGLTLLRGSVLVRGSAREHSFKQLLTARFGPGAFPAVAQFGCAYFVIFALYYYLVHPYPFHPHYFMTTFWLLPFFAAWSATDTAHCAKAKANSAADTTKPQARADGAGPARVLTYGLKGVLALLALCNFAFVAVAHDEIRKGHGTRELHHSSTRAEVQEATRQICELARQHQRTLVSAELNADGVLETPFVWFSSHLPECAGVSVDFGPTVRPSEALAVQISYRRRNPRDASLKVRVRQ